MEEQPLDLAQKETQEWYLKEKRKALAELRTYKHKKVFPLLRSITGKEKMDQANLFALTLMLTILEGGYTTEENLKLANKAKAFKFRART